eukprot:1183084-Pyramimonas_sp.AAC.1
MIPTGRPVLATKKKVRPRAQCSHDYDHGIQSFPKRCNPLGSDGGAVGSAAGAFGSSDVATLPTCSGAVCSAAGAFGSSD